MTSSFICVRDIDIPRVDIVIVLLLQLAGLKSAEDVRKLSTQGLPSFYLSLQDHNYKYTNSKQSALKNNVS